ncbi:MAG: hypothetical protein MUC42_06225 [Bryobacter sp.]|jgi:hypothetical protein|nr:hypothetical protein [Bryobacter sp.]
MKLLFGLLSAVALSAQVKINPATELGRAMPQSFENTWKDSKPVKMDCAIRRYEPRLGFEFRFWSGYEFSLPAKQFVTGKEHRLIAVTRVTPRKPAGPAVYFGQRYPLRPLPPEAARMRNLELTLGGGFYLGPGEYDVTVILTDEAGRQCRDQWKLKAKAGDVPVRLANGQLEDSGLDDWKGFEGKTGDPARVTVLVHAAPVTRRRHSAKLSPWDRTVLLGSLVTLLDQTRFTAARVIAVDLDGRRVLFEEENFNPRAYLRMNEVLREVSFATVSYQTLAKGPSEGQFVESLVRKELDRKDRSDALVIIGPAWRPSGKLSPLLKELRDQLPPVWYLSLSPWYGLDDVFDRFTRTSKGKVLPIYRPSDLAGALKQIK